MLDDHGLPQPDEVEYGFTCIRLVWHEEKTVLVVDIDEPPPGIRFEGEPAGLVDPLDLGPTPSGAPRSEPRRAAPGTGPRDRRGGEC
jgi:hypothetical protein